MDDTLLKILIALAVIVGLIIAVILFRLYVQGPYYKKKNRIDGKVVIVTGCNTGIGKETALELARRGAKVYMACRDSVKCEAARLEIVEKTKNQNVFNRTLDLSSLESVRKFAEKFLSEESRLDILINNAGVLNCPKTLTKDGLELQLGVNHFGHFLLTNLLLDRIKASAPSRIINVTSALYVFGYIKKDDINSEKSYSKIGAYTQSKLANILFTKQLAKKLEGSNVTANCLHPGVVKTGIFRHFATNRVLDKILKPFILYFFKTPKAGAQTTIRLALDPGLENVTGCYFIDSYYKIPVLPKARDPIMADWLWKKSEELTGLRSPINDGTVVEINTPNGA